MNDEITTWAELALRDAGFDTWTSELHGVTVFESPSIIGFLYVFDSSEELLEAWKQRQKLALRRHSPRLRSAGEKSWNVYSVFLTCDDAPGLKAKVERIDEDFELTRKIARSSIATKSDVELALLPLVRIRAHPLLDDTDIAQRLRSRLEEIPDVAVSAFLGEADPATVAQILGEHR